MKRRSLKRRISAFIWRTRKFVIPNLNHWSKRGYRACRSFHENQRLNFYQDGILLLNNEDTANYFGIKWRGRPECVTLCPYDLFEHLIEWLEFLRYVYSGQLESDECEAIDYQMMCNAR